MASFHKASGRYQAQVTMNGNRVSLGYFDTKEEAEEAEAARRRAEVE
jgi:AP2 domain